MVSYFTLFNKNRLSKKNHKLTNYGSALALSTGIKEKKIEIGFYNRFRQIGIKVGIV